MIYISLLVTILLAVTLCLMRKKMKYLLFAALIAIVFLIGFKAVKGFMPIPLGMRHLFHLLLQPSDFYAPIVKDKFNFGQEGFSRTYNLKPKYIDLYDVGLTFNQKVLSSKHKFNGQLKLEFISKGAVLYEEIVDAFKAWGSSFKDGYDMEFYKWIVLHTFEMPLEGKYIKDISVKITVLKPDPELAKHQDSIELYIGVSSIP